MPPECFSPNRCYVTAKPTVPNNVPTSCAVPQSLSRTRVLARNFWLTPSSTLIRIALWWKLSQSHPPHSPQTIQQTDGSRSIPSVDNLIVPVWQSEFQFKTVCCFSTPKEGRFR